MKRAIITIALAASLAISGMLAYAGEHASHKPPAKHAVVSAVCPVMGTTIPDVTKAAGKSVYNGKTYYFCCGGCKPQFDTNPSNYVK